MNADLLIEIGTEELPPKALQSLSCALSEQISGGLNNKHLAHGEVIRYNAPRRLAVWIKQLQSVAPDKQVVNWGPPAKVAFDAQGNLSRAGEAFANKNSLQHDQLSSMIENDGQQDKLCLRRTEPGIAATEVLEEIINAALSALPIPKRMRWGSSRVEFVRPLKWAVVLYGDTPVACDIFGVTSGQVSRGHRFHCDRDITINSAAGYADQMRTAWVIVDHQQRRDIIRQGAEQKAIEAGGRAVISEQLLDEVASLSEWPVPLIGTFDKQFLSVPAEALVSSMAEHQKYFHVVDERDKLMPLFITVANIESNDPSQVVDGNERVIRPRLADAMFFYQSDLKSSLYQRRERLKSVVFQAKLGSVYDKTERVAALCDTLAPLLGADQAQARRAAELCKSDLVSEMVGEFDDLQGIMGRYYAEHDGEDDDVAAAMFEQYLPRFAGDSIATTAVGATLAVADRLDTLCGIFGIGQPPSGSRDPFALRRASLGILRTIIERNVDLDLEGAVNQAIQGHDPANRNDETGKQVLTYIFDRFKAWYRDQGIDAEVFASVAALELTNPLDIDARVHAVHDFQSLPQAAALSAANKRVFNILSKQDMGQIPATIDARLLQEPAEKTLAAQLEQLRDDVAQAAAKRDYREALVLLAALQGDVDHFFDDVMVMCDDPATRDNRLALLWQLRTLFLNVADISHLAPSK